mmetsp:Transcript_4347/g.5952  ORF Transcript_4347/g.5952 Transcript_4347/m.5952 type:complete len:276 (-) Transcript_4347:237-1064(-)
MLRNVVALVSGGASGLGAATAANIIHHGGKVVVADLPSKRDLFLRLAASSCADAAKEGFDGSDPVIAFGETDVTNEDQVSSALDLAEDKFGEPVNAAICCAGIATAQKTLSNKKGSVTNFRVHSLQDFAKTLDVNVVGTFNVARLSAERMAHRKPNEDGLRGCIVNTASVAAFDGQVGQVAYSASKGAVVGMTLPLARDLAPHGIRVMTVAPGLFKTPLLAGLPDEVQNDLAELVPCPSRLGHPEEFGKLVASILTNPMLNGEVIRLDGALRMPP